MDAMTRNVPPHLPQCWMSMWRTHLSRCIQLTGAGRVVRFIDVASKATMVVHGSSASGRIRNPSAAAMSLCLASSVANERLRDWGET